jgi:hypothetical protein
MANLAIRIGMFQLEIARSGFCFDIYSHPAKMPSVKKTKPSVRVGRKASGLLKGDPTASGSRHQNSKTGSRVAEVNGDPAFLFLCPRKGERHGYV